jgi:hypothetical protein
VTPVELFKRLMSDQPRAQSGAVVEAVSLLDRFGQGKLGDGSHTYDDENGTVERYMVAGGGPSAWAVFIRIGDDLTGHVEYADSQGRTIVPLPDRDVGALREALRADTEERHNR